MTITPGTPATRRAAFSVAALALALVASVVLVGCGSDEKTADNTTTTSTAAATSAPTVSDVWARQVQQNGAAYMTIKGGSEADALVKAEVPADIAGSAELHETTGAAGSTTMGDGSMPSTTMKDGSMSTTTMAGSGGSNTTAMGGSGMMEMKPVDRIAVPADGTVELKPGGYHVMLLDMKKTLKAGDTFEVTLTFETAGVQKVTATVREA